MKKYLVFAIVFFLITATVLSMFYFSNRKFSQAEEEEFFKEYSVLIETNTPAETEVLVKNNIKRLSLAGATNAVSGYVYSILKYTDTANTVTETLQNEFKKEDKGWDFNKPNTINSIKNNMLKGFLAEIQTQRFIVEEYEGYYFVKPDFQYVVDKYGDYISDDLRDAIKYIVREDKNKMFNKTTSLFNFDLIVDKIIEGEDFVKKYPQSYYIAQVMSEKMMYYRMYFGADTSYGVYLTDNNFNLLEDVENSYRQTIEKYPDSQLAKDLEQYLYKLSETNNVVTDDVRLWLLDIIGGNK